MNRKTDILAGTVVLVVAVLVGLFMWSLVEDAKANQEVVDRVRREISSATRELERFDIDKVNPNQEIPNHYVAAGLLGTTDRTDWVSDPHGVILKLDIERDVGLYGVILPSGERRVCVGLNEWHPPWAPAIYGVTKTECMDESPHEPQRLN